MKYLIPFLVIIILIGGGYYMYQKSLGNDPMAFFSEKMGLPKEVFGGEGRALAVEFEGTSKMNLCVIFDTGDAMAGKGGERLDACQGYEAGVHSYVVDVPEGVKVTLELTETNPAAGDTLEWKVVVDDEIHVEHGEELAAELEEHDTFSLTHELTIEAR